MRRTKRIAASVLTGVLLFTSVFMPVPAEAQVKYDPSAEGNNGFYIDTVAVPNDKNIQVEGTEGNQTITAVKNVSFKLYSSVDASWSIEPADAEAGDGKVTIDEKSGEVEIQPDARGGNYTITATSENVETTDTETIKLKVDGAKAAKATRILWNKAAMYSTQMIVSEDEKTLTIDGTVNRANLAVKYEPNYLVDDAVTFQTDTGKEIYTLDAGKITTLKKLNDGEIECTVGETVKYHENLGIAVNEKEFTSKIKCEEMTPKDGELNLSRDQEISLICESNASETLPKIGITGIEWTLQQQSEELQAKPDLVEWNDIQCRDYVVMDKNGTEEFAHIYVPVNTKYNHWMKIFVQTTAEYEATDVPAVKLTATVSTDADNAGHEFHEHITLKFNPAQKAEPSKVSLDFSAAGLRENIDYSVRHDLDINNDGEITEEDPEVYYFEADEKNLDLVKATVSDVPGVRSFEDAKSSNFSGDEAAYKMTYEFQDAEIFGSESANKKYNNSGLNAEEFGADNTLKQNNIFTKQGLGYKKLTIECKKGTTQVDKKTYYIRFVSPSGQLDMEREYKISKDKETWYAYDRGETVHVRMGEAIVPGFYKWDEEKNKFVDSDKITLFNPFIEYEVEDESIATAVLSGESYRISGVNSGIVRVTARGAVNKSYTHTQTFELYVNKDTYPVKAGDFVIDFSAAYKSGVMSTANVIDGKQKNVPVGVSVSASNLGIPKLTWSLEWADPEETEELSEYAVVDEKTGAITTKKSTNSEIKIVATATGGISEFAKFTIAEVEGTSIRTLAEKVEVDGKAVVEALGENSGKCKVGNVFTLYPEDYLPENATKLSGTIKWNSSDVSVASVDKDGKVTALAETTGQPVVITATYTAGGNKADTEYKLTIEGSANPVTAIQAEDQVLGFKGAVVELKDKITVEPADATNKAVTYKSSDDSIVTVNQSGTVTAVNVGECTITITSVDNPDVTKTINITVKGESSTPKPVMVTAIQAEDQVLDAKGDVVELKDKITVEPADATNKAVTYKSSDDSIATVNQSGTVTAVGAGECTITITSVDNPDVTKTINITVKGETSTPKPVMVTAIQAEDQVLGSKGDVVELKDKITVEPADATNKEVTYKSSDNSIATVNQSGTVTAVGAGECMITITSVDNPDVTKTIKITVKGNSNLATGNTSSPSGQNPSVQTSANPGASTPAAPTSQSKNTKETSAKSAKKPVIKLAKKKIKRKKKTKIKIKYKAKGAKVTYKLDKKSKKIVSVSKKGVVKGKKKGTAKIVVTVKQNGKTYKKTLKIKVTK